MPILWVALWADPPIYRGVSSRAAIGRRRRWPAQLRRPASFTAEVHLEQVLVPDQQFESASIPAGHASAAFGDRPFVIEVFLAVAGQRGRGEKMVVAGGQGQRPGEQVVVELEHEIPVQGLGMVVLEDNEAGHGGC